MSALPDSWATASFTDVFDVQGGGQPPKSTFVYEPREGFVQLLQIRDFGARPVPTYIHDAENLKKCRVTDILIARYGASLGRILTGLEGAYNVAMAKVAIPEEIDRRFTFHLLNSEMFQAPLRLVSRSAQNGFNKEDLSGFQIGLAPLNEQKRIADKLDAVLARVDVCRDRIPTILKRFRQSVLAAATSGKLTEVWRKEQQTHECARGLISEIEVAHQAANIRVRGGAILPALSDLPDEVDLPESWVVAGFDAMAAPVGNALKAGPFGSALKKNIYVARGYKIYGQEQVIAGDESLGDYFIDEQKYEELSSCAVTSGDILISLVGTIGRVLILSDRCADGIINPRLVKLSLYPSLNREFVSLYLQSPLAQNFFKAKSHGGTMDILNLGILRELPILLPPITEQTEIVRRVESLFAYADRLEARYTAARAQVEKLTPATLAKAFRGELVPQDPNDEPASILLQRIRTARNSQVTNPPKCGRRKQG